MIRLHLIIFLLSILLISCGSVRNSEPIKEPMALNTELLKMGEIEFKEHCDSCHPNGESGLGPALNNKEIIPTFVIRFQVRNGLGMMPSFSEEQIPSEELDAILEYLGALEEQ